MFGLLYKEMITQRKQLLMFTPFLLLCLTVGIIIPITTANMSDAQFGLSTVLCITMVMLLSGMLEQGTFANDEMTKWQNFIVSTPDGVHKQIASKYIFNIGIAGIAVNILLIVVYIAGAIANKDIALYSLIVISFFSLQIFVRAFESPFLVRFGSKYGNIFRMVCIALLTFGVTIYLLFGDLSIFGSLDSFLNFMKELAQKDGFIYTLRLTPVLCLILYYLSYRISCCFYLKGGAYYDK